MSERSDRIRGNVALSDEKLHCLICAMSGNFPERFETIRMDLLRKLSKAQLARKVVGERTNV